MSGDVDVSGTTIQVWDSEWAQSDPAEAASKELEQKFQEEYDVTLEWNRANPNDLYGGKWRQQVSQGNMPDLFLFIFGPFCGQFIAQDVAAPLSDVRQYIDDQALSGLEWQQDMLEDMHSGLDEVYGIPAMTLAQDPFVVRRDIMESVGVWSDFPPSSYDQLVDIATALQESGEVEHGFPVYAAGGDAFDEIMPCWAAAEGGDEGRIFTDDWKDVRLDNEVWKNQMRRYVELEREHNVSWGRPTSGDEDTVEPLMAGNVAFTQQNMLNFPTFLDRAEDMMKEGTIQYAPAWEGGSGLRGVYLPYTSLIVDRAKAEGMDQTKANKKKKAAALLVNKLLSEEWQERIPNAWGMIPTNDNAWDSVEQTTKEEGWNHNAFQSLLTILEGAEYGWAIHPDSTTVQYQISPPYAQQALQGDIGPEEAMDQIADEIRTTVFR